MRLVGWVDLRVFGVFIGHIFQRNTGLLEQIIFDIILGGWPRDVVGGAHFCEHIDQPGGLLPAGIQSR